MKVLICGSREFNDPFTVALAIDKRISELPEACTIIHGAARGADQIAAEAAHRHGHTVKSYPANWKTHGKRAGIIRNIQMLAAKPDLVIAFWNGHSKGAAHTIGEAKRMGIPVEVFAA